ncbi:MAG TPA: D-alanyl-D-alanine carboxypeptidase [Thermoanaerobacterales bacterium]|nr:D-alanyl-D-alanine carboxypeptidase [Thermoanaerobacterales bacterium]
MKKTFCFILVLFIVLGSFEIIASASTVLPANSGSPPSITGETAVLIDAKTGKILYDKNAHIRMEPASTTKIMTAILALEKGKLMDVVVTGKEPPLADGTRIYLEEGEKLTLEQMLYALLLNSANDAAVAIAEHIGGDVTSFVKMMNEKAREIGAKDTTFVNPNGLPAEGHLTTAYDLALMTRYALLNFPEFRKIVSTKTFNIPWQGKEWDRKLINLNKLLWNYDGADGVKTGYTSSAGQTIVASATKNGWQLIAVVLKSKGKDVWTDAESLLDYGFNNFQPETVIEKGSVVASEKVKYGDSVELETLTGFYTVIPRKTNPLTTKTVVNPNIIAPVKKGETLGELEILENGQKIGSVPLVAREDVPRKIYTKWWFWPAVISLIFYTPFRIMVGIRRYKRYKNQARYISYVKKYR